MNEEAITVAYNLFVADGYKKSIEEFKTLMQENPKGREVAYSLFVSDGYKKDISAFEVLMGVGTQQPIVAQEASVEKKNTIESTVQGENMESLLPQEVGQNGLSDALDPEQDNITQKIQQQAIPTDTNLQIGQEPLSIDLKEDPQNMPLDNASGGRSKFADFGYVKPPKDISEETLTNNIETGNLTSEVKTLFLDANKYKKDFLLGKDYKSPPYSGDSNDPKENIHNYFYSIQTDRQKYNAQETENWKNKRIENEKLYTEHISKILEENGGKLEFLTSNQLLSLGIDPALVETSAVKVNGENTSMFDLNQKLVDSDFQKQMKEGKVKIEFNEDSTLSKDKDGRFKNYLDTTKDLLENQNKADSMSGIEWVARNVANAAVGIPSSLFRAADATIQQFFNENGDPIVTEVLKAGDPNYRMLKNTLTVLDNVSEFLNKGQRVYGKDIAESIEAGNYKDAAAQMTKTTVDLAPIIALSILTPEVAPTVFAAGAYGEKLSGMQSERREAKLALEGGEFLSDEQKRALEYNNWNMLGNAGAYGLLNYYLFGGYIKGLSSIKTASKYSKMNLTELEIAYKSSFKKELTTFAKEGFNQQKFFAKINAGTYLIDKTTGVNTDISWKSYLNDVFKGVGLTPSFYGLHVINNRSQIKKTINGLAKQTVGYSRGDINANWDRDATIKRLADEYDYLVSTGEITDRTAYIYEKKIAKLQDKALKEKKNNLEGVDKLTDKDVLNFAKKYEEIINTRKAIKEVGTESEIGKNLTEDLKEQQRKYSEELEIAIENATKSKNYESLSPEEKIKLQDRAIDQMEKEMADQGIEEYDLISEMVDIRANKILQEDINNSKEGDLKEDRLRDSQIPVSQQRFTVEKDNGETIIVEVTTQLDGSRVVEQKLENGGVSTSEKVSKNNTLTNRQYTTGAYGDIKSTEDVDINTVRNPRLVEKMSDRQIEAANIPVAETIASSVNKPVVLTEQGGSKLDVPVEGDLYIEGKRVVVEDANGKIYDVGNIDDIGGNKLSELGITVEKSSISVKGNNILYKGEVVIPVTSNPISSIKTNRKGNVNRVVLKSEDGKNTYTLKGREAEDAAYEILLKEADKRGILTEKKLSQNETFKNELRKTEDDAKKGTDKNIKQDAAEETVEQLLPTPAKAKTEVKENKPKAIEEETKQLFVFDDVAENKSTNEKFTEKDNPKQEPSIKAIERKTESERETILNRVVEETTKKLEEATGVTSKKVSEISTDESRFQGRKKLNEDVVNDISDNWKDADQDPIHVWTDPKTKETFVLSGHHRLAGAKQAGRKTVKIVDRTNDFNEAQAIKFATEDANANRTMETPLERATTLRKKRNNNEPKEEINTFIAREGKNKTLVENLSYLNPDGMVIQAMESFEKTTDVQNQNEITKIADWIGNARKNNKDLTDAHEKELFDFLNNKETSGRIKNKRDFLSKVNSITSEMFFDGSKPLNIARFKNKTEGEAQYDKEVTTQKEVINELQAKKDNLKDRLNNPKNPEYIHTTDAEYSEAVKRANILVSDIDKQLKVERSKLQEIYQDKGKYQRSGLNQGGLFDTPAPEASEKAERIKASNAKIDDIVNSIKGFDKILGVKLKVDDIEGLTKNGVDMVAVIASVVKKAMEAGIEMDIAIKKAIEHFKTKFDFDVNVDDIKARLNNITKYSIQETPKSFENIKNGVDQGNKLWNRVEAFRKKLTDKNDKATRLTPTEINKKVSDYKKTLSQTNLKSSQINDKVSDYQEKLIKKNKLKAPLMPKQEIIDKTIEFLEQQPEYINESDTYTVGSKKKGTQTTKNIKGMSSQQARMITEFQKTVGIRPSENMSEKLRIARFLLIQREKGVRDIEAIKRQLKIFIRKAIPAETYSKPEVIDLINKISIAKKSNIENLFQEVLEIASRKNIESLEAKINSILYGKYEDVQNGNVKGQKISLKVKERIEAIKENILSKKATAEDINNKIKELEDLWNKLSIEENPTEKTFDSMLDIEAAIELNNAALIKTNDIYKVGYLDSALKNLKGLEGNGRAEAKEELRLQHEEYIRQRKYIYEDITGEPIDDLKNIDIQARERTQAKKAKEVRNKIGSLLNKITTSISQGMFGTAEALDGLMHRISLLPGEMFGGRTQEIVTERIDEGSRNFKEQKAIRGQAVRHKLEELYKSKWRKRSRTNRVPEKTGIYINEEAVKKAQEQYAKDPSSINKKLLTDALLKNELILSQNQMYYLYNQYKNPNNHGSFESVKMYGVEAYSKTDSKEETSRKQLVNRDNAKRIMDSIESKMTKETKDFADWQVNELFPALYLSYNEVHKKINRTNLPWNQFYAGTIYRDGVAEEPLDLLSGKKKYTSGVGAKNTKRRVNNNLAIKAMDGTDVLMTYINDMEYWAAFAEPIRDINKLFTNDIISSAISDIHGSITLSLIKDSIQKIANKGVRTGLLPSFVNGMNDVFIIGKLALSPVIMIKQMSSFVTYANDIGYGNWIYYAAKSLPEIITTFKEIRDNSVYLKDRYSHSIMSQLESYSESSRQTFIPNAAKDFFIDFLMFTTKFGDATAIYMGGMPNYNYYKAQFKKENPAASEKEIINYAIRKFERDTKRTQQSNDLQDRDYLQTSHPLVRAANMFLTTPKQYLRKEIQASRNLYRKISQKDINAGKGTLMDNLRTLFTYHVFAPMFFQYLSMGLPGLLRGWRDDDDEDLLRAAVLGNINGLFILGEMFIMAADFFTGKPWAGENTKSVGILSIAASITKKAKEADAIKDPVKRAEAWHKVQLELLTIGAIPAPTIQKYFDNYSKIIEGGEDPGTTTLRLLNYSEYQITGPRKKAEPKPKPMSKETMKILMPELYETFEDLKDKNANKELDFFKKQMKDTKKEMWGNQ
jgi:hypothetical protein